MDVLLLIDRETFSEQDPEMLDASREHAGQVEYQVASALRKLGHAVRVLPITPDAGAMVSAIRSAPCQMVFNLTEHWGGHRHLDQHITALLDLLGLPYTGSGPNALMLCRDKALSKQVLQHHGLRVPRFVTLDPGHTTSRKRLKFPVIVKPGHEDGSDGIAQASLVKTTEELKARVEQLHKSHGRPVICEEYIEGRELYVGIVGNQRLKALPAREVVFGQAAEGGPTFATSRVKTDEEYRKKWDVRYDHADIPAALQRKAEVYCKKAYRLLGIRDYGRIDLRVDGQGHIFFLEANANPDLSMEDELASSWAKAGGDYTGLVRQILELAIRRSGAS